jgi:hypothetical protein
VDFDLLNRTLAWEMLLSHRISETLLTFSWSEMGFSFQFFHIREKTEKHIELQVN